MIVQNDTLSPREAILIEKDTEENRLGREHAIRMGQLQIQDKQLQLKLKLEAGRQNRDHQKALRQMELQSQELQNKWNQVWRIPTLIIKLPVYIILAVGATIWLARKGEAPTEILKLLK